jgi:N12 class adenine-specific DNA methylase
LIYLDPQSKQWQTADAYLSGNVRDKLAVAEKAGQEYARNAEALRKVQPEDVLPGDIDAGLGAPWIPEKDIQQFAAELFRVPPASVPVAHIVKDALWKLDADYAAEKSVGATSEFGTKRANGTWLLDLALNMKTPVIYDTVQNGDREERVVNPQATFAAKEKQKLIKERFRNWVFAAACRAEAAHCRRTNYRPHPPPSGGRRQFRRPRAERAGNAVRRSGRLPERRFAT